MTANDYNPKYMDSTHQPDFQRGYASGLDGVERDTYEGFLSSQVSTDWLTDRIDEKRTELAALDRTITETTEANRTTYADLQNHTLQVERLAKQARQREADRQALEAERVTLRDRRTRAASEYSLLAGLLFFVAGIAFLAGDLIISHEIVAYALNIRNPNEAWAFAVGLAMVSILLKPAYDRLIEQPYQENRAQNQTKYERFKVALGVFAVLTLAVLGWFRYEAYRTDQLKAAINKSIRQLQLNTDPTAANQTLDAATLGKIEKQLAESSELNLALVNSPWALLSFVLSGILFALAGAVCLGIALPVLSAFWFRWLQADPKLWKLRRRLKRLNRELLPLETQLAEQQTFQSVLQHNFDLLPALDDLRHQQQTLTADLNAFLAEQKLTRIDSRINTFSQGYNQGEAARLTLSDDEQRRLQQDRLHQQMGNRANGNRPADEQPIERPNGSANGGTNGAPDKVSGLQPHQLVRTPASDDL